MNILWKNVMYLLTSLLMKRNQIGSNLIKYILHCFSFSYGISVLSIVTNDIKLFDVITRLLIVRILVVINNLKQHGVCWKFELPCHLIKI